MAQAAAGRLAGTHGMGVALSLPWLISLLTSPPSIRPSCCCSSCSALARVSYAPSGSWSRSGHAGSRHPPARRSVTRPARPAAGPDLAIAALDLPQRHVHRESKKPAHCLDLTYQSRSDDGRATVVMG